MKTIKELILVVLIGILLPGPLWAEGHHAAADTAAPAVLVQTPAEESQMRSPETTAPEADGTIASTSLGQVRGRKIGNVVVWRGVPYAQPPVGALRFAAPVPVQPWTGVRDALAFGPTAPQPRLAAARYTGKEANQSEDCLYLNIWARPGTANRPVMVWIHGGAYMSGAGSEVLYDGTHLAETGNVVVVTINYRLGALGCMHFTDLARAAGITEGFVDNPALRDQVAALAWVHDNITAFGGDPGKVTIFGESAGGSSVIALLCTPSAKGLFQRAIAQSPAPAHIYGRATGTAYAKQLLNLLGLSPGEVGRLRELPAADLMRATRTLMDLNAVNQPGSIPFGPTWGTETLPLDPLSAAANGATARVPLIIGTNRDEATLFELIDPPILPITSQLFNRMLDLTNADKKERILSAYPAYPSRRGVIEAATDAVFRQPTMQFADAYSRHAPTWAYRFDYVAPLPGLMGMGATHCAEIVHVFHTYRSPIGRIMSMFAAPGTKRRLGDAMQSSWLAFAATGDPNGSAASDAPWPVYETPQRPTRIFGTELSTVTDPDPQRRETWQGVTTYH